MVKGLQAAQAFAESVRFSGDKLRRKTEGDLSRTRRARSLLFQHELQISREVTPFLHNRLVEVYERLQIPSGSVEAFVYSSREIQADCFAGDASESVIRFSSSLIDLLDEKEFQFVAGHELGHFLLGHGVAHLENENQSLEYFMQQRSQEISVDRIGLLSCQSLDVAIRALMKSASGLSSRHLRFDVGTFVSQLRKASDIKNQTDHSATHPSILVRCRALLWFSLSDVFAKGAQTIADQHMSKLNKLVEGDLEKYVDGRVRERIAQAKQDVAIWFAALEIIRNGKFDRSKQATMADMFGNDSLERLKNFLKEIPAVDVEHAVYERMKSARDELERMIPNSFSMELERIRERISSTFAPE